MCTLINPIIKLSIEIYMFMLYTYDLVIKFLDLSFFKVHFSVLFNLKRAQCIIYLKLKMNTQNKRDQISWTPKS